MSTRTDTLCPYTALFRSGEIRFGQRGAGLRKTARCGAIRPTHEMEEQTIPQRAWHSVEPGMVFDAFETSPEGLSAAEASERLRKFGPNRLPVARRRSILVRFLLQFHNVLIYVLLVAAVISALLGQVVDTAVILGVVVLNAIVGVVQEGRAERSLEAIRGLINPSASVLRNGRRLVIPADEVVPGDIVLIEAGDRLPADIRSEEHTSELKSLMLSSYAVFCLKKKKK